LDLLPKAAGKGEGKVPLFGILPAAMKAT